MEPQLIPSEDWRMISPTEHLCAVTSIGQVRDQNEDAIHLVPEIPALIVADGMGGHPAGEVASVLAVETVANRLRQPIALDYAGVESLLTSSFDDAQEAVLADAESNPERRGMGTTLIVACVLGDRLLTCHVGDVRAYVRTSQGIEQITRDHTIVGALVQTGEITPDEARVHPEKNAVLQAIGLPEGFVPGVNSRTLRDGDIVLLCSDGLWEALSDAEIDAILMDRGSLAERAALLIKASNDAGGWDNISVALYQHIGS